MTEVERVTGQECNEDWYLGREEEEEKEGRAARGAPGALCMNGKISHGDQHSVKKRGNLRFAESTGYLAPCGVDALAPGTLPLAYTYAPFRRDDRLVCNFGCH